MFNMGFQGQFGGGFIQGPSDAVTAGAGVTYSQPAQKTKPKDRSGRKSPYMFSSHSGRTHHQGRY